jgi:hypothetical protein
MCSNWYDPSNASSDYFNSIFNYPGMQSFNTPQNFAGFQFAHTGNAYAGYSLSLNIYPYYEYISVKLKQILISNKKYCLQYYASQGDNSIPMLQNIGIAFHPDSLTDFFPTSQPWIYAPLANINPQILNTSVSIIDKDLWYELKGSFIANGNDSCKLLILPMVKISPLTPTSMMFQ